MAGATQRSYKAGKLKGEAIVETVHLFYQNNTAAHYYRGLDEVLKKEIARRRAGKEVKNVVAQSCATMFTNPPERSGAFDWQRFIVHYEDGTSEIVFQGEKWDDEMFEEKKRLHEGR